MAVAIEKTAQVYTRIQQFSRVLADPVRHAGVANKLICEGSPRHQMAQSK